MAARVLDGKEVSAAIRADLADRVRAATAAGFRPPHLVAILIGHNPASETYVAGKLADCRDVGYDSSLERYDDHLAESWLLERLAQINQDDNIDGVIVQLPLPRHIREHAVIEAIHPDKDVDGFHPVNIGRMAKTLPALLPATPAGILELLRYYNIDTVGKEVVVIGRSNIVGSPISILLARNAEQGNATVTITHSKTRNLVEHTRRADILVVAAGQREMIKADMVKSGACVIDVGMHRIADPSKKSGYRLVGDVDLAAVREVAGAITPVPGGVGPMTRAMLLLNTWTTYQQRVGFRVGV